ncbi:MAG: exodeoxyribonuclease III [Proteobacteria bacterium]|nr:exodeoxyribonuclease III [Pseudomonadota bacterium]
MLKVATWNVNSLRIRLTHVLDWMEVAQPDVLCLQETKVEDSLFPHSAFTELGYHTACHGQKSYNGVALISRTPLQNVALGFNGHNLEEQTRVISATVETPLGPTRVISAYVPNGQALDSPKFAFKQAFYQHLTSHIQAEVKSHPNLILAGDFNIAADERDVVNPTRAAKDVLFTPQEREWLSQLQKQTGLADAFRQVSQEEHIFSWWDYRMFARTPNTGMRIDYLFTSPALTPHLKAVQHFAEERRKTQPSDHIPVLAEFA